MAKLVDDQLFATRAIAAGTVIEIARALIIPRLAWMELDVKPLVWNMRRPENNGKYKAA
jgi:hypothetical protein